MKGMKGGYKSMRAPRRSRQSANGNQRRGHYPSKYKR